MNSHEFIRIYNMFTLRCYGFQMCLRIFADLRGLVKNYPRKIDRKWFPQHFPKSKVHCCYFVNEEFLIVVLRAFEYCYCFVDRCSWNVVEFLPKIGHAILT
jgi:hypothetical protein